MQEISKEQKQNSLKNYLKNFIESSGLAEGRELASVILSVFDSCRKVYAELQAFSSIDDQFLDSFNATGDRQLVMDMRLHNIIVSELRKNRGIASVSSEETARILEFAAASKSKGMDNSAEAKYHVAFDPLDGSSQFKRGLNVGSIFSIWKGNTALLRKPRESLEVACYALYSYRMFFALAFRGEKLLLFKVSPNGDTSLGDDKLWLKKDNDFFSPGNIRASTATNGYLPYINEMARAKKTLRYNGCLVADIHAMLISGSGIFTYPPEANKKNKLRLVFELIPIAALVEACGGLALDCESEAILDKTPILLSDTSSFVAGSSQAVESFLRFFQKKT